MVEKSMVNFAVKVAPSGRWTRSTLRAPYLERSVTCVMRTFVFLLSVLALGAAQAGGVAGKYELSERGANVTGTHSHFLETHLEIQATKPPRAMLFTTDNGDIIGQRKEVFFVQVEGAFVNLVPVGCIHQEFIGDKEFPCEANELRHPNSYKFKLVGLALTLLSASDRAPLQPPAILKKVARFSAE